MGEWVLRLILWVVAAFYAYDAYGHVASIAGMHGFTWAEAPLKWQLIDIVYLALDIVVVAGLLLRWFVGTIAFFAASVSQVVLYTLFRSWIVDVPVKFTPTPDHIGYLNMLVGIHVAAILLVLVALRMGGMKKDASEG